MAVDSRICERAGKLLLPLAIVGFAVAMVSFAGVQTARADQSASPAPPPPPPPPPPQPAQPAVSPAPPAAAPEAPAVPAPAPPGAAMTVPPVNQPVAQPAPQPGTVPQPGGAPPTSAAQAAASGQELPAVAPTPAPVVNPNDPNVPPPTSNVLANLLDPFDYDPRGRRDPFGQPVADKPLAQGNPHGPLLPLQKYELNQLRLTAILWNVRDPKAILKDPLGAVYIVGPNAKIGPRNGYIASIREGEIVVVETNELDGRLVSTAQVVKIGK